MSYTLGAVDYAMQRLPTEEGFRALVYKDTRGHNTIGYGFDIDAGISKFAAEALLKAQVQERHISLLSLPWYAALDPIRQSVCIDISFNAGENGLLLYHRMITALSNKDFEAAATECTTTAPELQSRYRMLAEILRSGKELA